MPELYKPFVHTLFNECHKAANRALNILSQMEELNDVNVAAVAGVRGALIPPLNFMLLLADYPEITANIIEDEATFFEQLLLTRQNADVLAEEIAEQTGRVAAQYELKPNVIDDPDQYKAYTVLVIDMALDLIQLARREIGLEGEITAQNVAFVHALNSSLLGVLNGMRVVKAAGGMLATIGKDEEAFLKQFDTDLEFARANEAIIQPIIYAGMAKVSPKH